MKLTLNMIETATADFDSNSVFSKLTPVEFQQLLIDYYTEKQSVTQLMTTYHLNLNPTLLVKNFPPISLQITCPFDKTPMQATLPAKYKLDLDTTISCPKCTHIITDLAFPDYSVDCQCVHCERKRQQALQGIQSLLTQSRGKKRAETDLTTQEALDLACVLIAFNSHRLTNIGTYHDHSDSEELLAALVRLQDSHLLVASEDSQPKTFEYKHHRLYVHPQFANWHVWVDSPNDDDFLLNSLKNPQLTYNSEADDLSIIYLKQVEIELLHIFQTELTEHHFSLTEEHNTQLKDTIDRLLANYTPSQVYTFIWRAVRMAQEARTKNTWGNYRYHPIDYVVRQVTYLIQFFSEKPDPVPSYRFPKSVVPELATQLFFEDFLGKPNWFYEPVSPMQGIDTHDMPKRMLSSRLEPMLQQRETQLTVIPDLVKNAQSYKMIDYGIVVISDIFPYLQLFTDQLTAYEYSQTLPELDHNTLSWSLYNADYYITNFYSLKFCYALLAELEKQKVPKVE
ncbi:hypothetical protein [Secundilactobacillus similis]|uniref:Uncharacterized protein n=1 Tax=Secundilactobacillus similis DSM 23365 = JCM 2765 TaxID=1423804 RepID=A0A0R2FAN8_9LACO|nr:hypothetical protein [Secundilactobacillus similis]KRN25416.1 hypothetical protein FD14_GL000301 [Secundilactobacillus similis DSM 23365 = JCM 2765]